MDRDPAFLLSRAEKCRNLAKGIDDQRTKEALAKMAEECEALAREITEERSKGQSGDG